MEQITIIGLGYVGLPLAISFAMNGIKVYGYDISKDVIKNISHEKQFTEPNLLKNLDSVLGKFLFISKEIEPTGTYIVCVQTPLTNQNEEDVSYIYGVIDELCPILRPDDLIVIESTIGAGTNQNLLQKIAAKIKFPIETISYAYCPESIYPGNIFDELKFNTRIIGANNQKSFERVQRLYETINEKPILKTTIKSAELLKLIQNAYRDIEIAFANELSMLCANLEIDVFELIRLANTHPRIKILQPGSGVGGHCIAVDPYFLIYKYPKFTNLSKTAREINAYKPYFICDQVERLVKKTSTIGVFGLSYKPNIEDTRGSSGLIIVNELLNRGYHVVACEPNISHVKFGEIENLPIQAFLSNIDFLVVCQKHNVSEEVRKTMKSIPNFDAVGMF